MSQVIPGKQKPAPAPAPPTNPWAADMAKLTAIVESCNAANLALVTKVKALQAKVDTLSENAVQSKNWQAIVVSKSGQLLIVAKDGDTDGDGHVSQKEAIAAANAYIVEKGLAAHYKASALPTW